MVIAHDKVKELRESKGLSHADIADAADLSVKRIQQIERGKLKKLNRNIAKAIARRLGVRLEDLYESRA